MRKNIIIIEQGDFQSRGYIAKRLFNLGYRMTLVTEIQLITEPELYDEVVYVQLSNIPEIFKQVSSLHKRKKYIGVYGYNEPSMDIVNRVAKHLDLPSISESSGNVFRDKEYMRILWESWDLKSPKFEVINKKKDIYKLNDFTYPIVLKPTTFLGSIGVVKANNFDEVHNKVTVSQNADIDLCIGNTIYTLSELYGFKNNVIAEEYIPGREFSAEGVIINGEYKLISVVEKYVSDNGYFDELGHIYPSNLSVSDELKDVLSRAHKALKLNNVLTHSEFKVNEDGIFMIEVGARLAGDKIPEIIRRGSGLDLVDISVRARCNESMPPNFDMSENNKHWTGIVFISANENNYGKLFKELNIDDLDKTSILEVCSYYYEGERILYPNSRGKVRIGYILFNASTYSEVKNMMEEIPYKVREIVDED